MLRQELSTQDRLTMISRAFAESQTDKAVEKRSPLWGCNGMPHGEPAVEVGTSLPPPRVPATHLSLGTEYKPWLRPDLPSTRSALVLDILMDTYTLTQTLLYGRTHSHTCIQVTTKRGRL